MSGKPEPPRAGASASGLHNVVVYVSGDGFGYPQQNNGNNAIYQSASTVKPKVPAQGFYNVHNGYQGNNVNYSSNSVVNQIYPPRNASVGRREDGNFLAVMGGESGIGGTVVFPRCDSARSEVAESSCSSLSSSGGDSQSDSRTASTDNVSVSVSATVTQQQFKTSAENNSVTVPFGWKRLHTNGMVIYVSPSNTALSSLDQVKAYLQTQGTCKCGLECPIKCDIVFNFDPKVATRPWSMASAPPGDLTKLCNHKRKLLAMNSIEPNQLDMKKIEAGTARKKRRPGNVVGNTGTSTGSASVSQLLAQRERERSKESAQGWSDGSTQMGRDGSPMMMQGQMVSTPPIANRSVYLPGYQDRNASHPTNHPNGTPFFRYNPHTTNVNMNQCASTHPGQQPSQIIENNQMMNSETGYTVGNNVHSPVVMTNAVNQNQNANVVMHPTCGTNMNSMMFNHQQQNMNFYQQQQQQQQRLHMNCDNTETQHGHCNPINKPVMNQQQQIILQQQQQQQQQLINQQSHFQQHQLAQHNMPQHVMNPSSSPRPQHNQHMVPSSHHHYENRIGQQFQNQQFTHQEHHNMNKMHVVQQQHCNKPQVMSVNRDSYQNRSDIPVSLHQIQQGSTMVLQTSQGQVMLPNGQTVGQTMVLHNQQGSPIQVSQSGICQQNQMSQPIQTMSLQGSSMVVQTSTGATLIPSGNQQNQMVLHGQQNSQMVQQGLQVQTIPGQQATVVLQGHQTQNIQNSQVQNNNGICTSPAMLMHHQRPAPPWQQNRNHNVINQQQLQPNPYERVPPLHHHTPPAPVWNDDVSRKKNTKAPKPTAHLKKRSPYNDHHSHHHNASESPCPNVDVRHLPQDQNKPPTSQAYTNNIPSFMEDPSGYLAQQTALLNSTISRQTGVNSNGVNIICHSPCNSQNMNDQNNTGQVLINIPTSNCSPVGNQGVPIPSNVLVSSANKSVNQFTIRPNLNQPNSLKVYRSNSVSSTGSGVYHNQSQTIIPDSSGVSPDRGRCPQGCSSNMFDNIQQNQHQHGINIKQFQSDDNPVTSSTFMENRGQVPISMSDNRGPIQGGTVSTSNRSPVEMNRIPPDDPSPGGSSTPSSSQNCHIDASPEPPNIFISASSPYTITNANQVLYSQNQTVAMSRNQDVHPQKHQNINVLLQDIVTSRVPTVVTTMASGHTVSSNTITSVLAGRANTATVTVNNPTTVAQTIPSNILTNQQISQVSLPKSPLEMVQSVVSSIQVPASSASNDTVLKSAGPSLPTGHILVSSNGQLIVTNNPGPSAILSPQQNMQKLGNPPMPPMTGVSSIVTSVTGAVTQVIPTVGVTQQVLGQPTVLVNTLPAPLLFQPGVMTVDGTMNTVQIPHLAVATNNVIQGQMVEDNRVNNSNGAFSPRNQPALLSPEGSNGKRKSANKKRKVSPQTVASMLHIAAQQNSPNAGTSMVVQQQQPQQNYGNATPMLQALTILPSKGGHFGGTQQLIATANVLQPLNLVQNFPTIQQFIVPAGLGGMVMATGDGTATLLQDTVHLNVLTPVQGPGGTVFGHTSGQSILTAGPAGMVIRTPNNSQQGKMLHPQNVTTNGGGQFIANSPNQLFMNSPAFGGQLSPMLNVSPTNQQIHSFNTQGTNNQNRPGQAEFIQCGQTLMVPCSIAQNPPSQNTTVVQQNTTIVQQQTTMVSNNQQTMAQSPGPSTSSSSSLSLNQHNFILNNSDNKQQNFIITADKQGQGNFILSPNPDKHQSTHIILNNISPPDKQSQSCGGFIISQEKPNQMCGNFILSNSSLSEKSGNFIISGNLPEKHTRFAKHSVSTQTAANQQVLQVSSTPVPTALVVATTNTFCQTSTAPSSYSGSPPDTTTHSPIDGGPSQSPGLNSEAPTSSVAIGSDDNLSSPTSSSDPSGRAQPMVHCVSSSNEQDSPDWTSKEGTASSPAVFSPPPVSMELMYNRNVGGALKTLSMNSYVESSSAALHYEAERIHKRNSDQELLARQIYEYGSHARMNKRKHTFDNEARIHTSTVTTLLPQDDEDGESDESDLSSVSEGEGPGPGAGDLVWGAARGFPSWPGKLVGPAPTPGRVWVRWFGGAGNLSEVDPSHLKTLSEGLEAHHRARKKFRKSRKLNSQLENAIQEAMAELDRMSETPQQGAPVPPHSLVIAEGKTKRTHR